MKVKCIHRGNNSYIALGLVYTVISEDSDTYTITNDSGDVMSYSKHLFGVVEEPKAEPSTTADPVRISEDQSGWTNTHYSFEYKLTEDDYANQTIRIDPYFVARQWRLGQKDDSGVLFHCLKTIARFGGKNAREREIKAMYAQVKRLAELEGVSL